MLIYNTSFHVEDKVHDNFLIWLKECYIPQAGESGVLRLPRLLRLLSHQEEGSTSYSLQWEVENSGELHKWHLQQGAGLQDELSKIFGHDVVAFPTLMEIVE